MTKATPLFLAASIALAGSLPEDGRRWWKHVEYLASDALQGRAAGTQGHRVAAEYVADQFRRAGLKTSLQPVNFESRTIDESRSSLALVANRQRTALVLGEHAIVSLRVDPPASLKAPLVFAGYGIHAPDDGHDDLAGLDLRGKIAVYFAAPPARLRGAVASHYQSADERWHGLAEAGAVGAISISLSPEPGAWARSVRSRLDPAMSLPGGGVHGKLAVSFNSLHAGMLFEGSGHQIGDLMAKAKQGDPLAGFPLVPVLDARVSVARGNVISVNVLAMLEGADPDLHKEVVVVTAHLDHLGQSAPVNGDTIYNGAMDNASGVASLIEIGSALRNSGLKRTVLFAAVTGEEKGLLGSKYLVTQTENAVANLNFDMFLPLFPLTSVMALGLDESDLGDHLRRVAEPLGLAVQSDPEPARNRFTRSDQYSFIRKGIPALAFKFGYQKGSPEEETARKWNAERYHRPSDDAAQYVDRGAAAAFNDVMARLIESVANAGQPARWKAGSFFRRFAVPPPPTLVE